MNFYVRTLPQKVQLCFLIILFLFGLVAVWGVSWEIIWCQHLVGMVLWFICCGFPWLSVDDEISDSSVKFNVALCSRMTWSFCDFQCEGWLLVTPAFALYKPALILKKLIRMFIMAFLHIRTSVYTSVIQFRKWNVHSCFTAVMMFSCSIWLPFVFFLNTQKFSF